jgi:hypothetical protein
MFLALFDVADMKSKLFLAQSILHVWSIWYLPHRYFTKVASTKILNNQHSSMHNYSKVYAHNMSLIVESSRCSKILRSCFFLVSTS